MQFIEESEVRAAILDSITEALLVVNQNGTIVFANEVALEMFGYPLANLIDRPIECLIPLTAAKHHVELRNQYMETPSKRRMGKGLNLSALHASGKEFPVEVSLNYFKKDLQIFVLALITDISDRRVMELELLKLKHSLEEQVVTRTKELEQSRALYEVIARNFPNGTINVFDEQFNYLFVEGRELFKRGITSKNLIGTNYFTRLPASVSELMKEKLSVLGDHVELSFEVLLDEKVYQINALKINMDNQKRILLVEQNISNQKIAQRKVEEALEKQKDLNELKSRFVSMASHEFRTPLSTILSSADLASKYVVLNQKDKQVKHLDRIKSSVKNLTSILNDFLSLSKLEEDKLSILPTSFEVGAFIKEVVDEFEDNLKGNQKISIEINERELYWKTDQNIFKNILINLISNASKYSDEEALIQIILKQKEALLCIEIIDKGIGMSEADQKHLFERFFRATNATNIQGTGLGLHIVKRYIELLGGSIGVNSVLNQGSTFSIEIP